jgi:predicted RNA methylase
MSDCPQDHFNRIWQLFAAQGISDDLQILESVAYLLLVEQAGQWAELEKEVQDLLASSVSFSGNITLLRSFSELADWPRLSSALSAEKTASLIRVVRHLLDNSDMQPTDLFNRCLLFQLDAMRVGGQYPTPRHIASLMASLVNIFEVPATVADFACGSGGLLVEFGGSDVIGIEISSTWARLARANLHLHNHPAQSIFTGDALKVTESEFTRRGSFLHSPERNAHLFNAILMNPPFGHPLELSHATWEFSDRAGRRSETVLALLALDYLQESGVLAVLQPGGTLFSTGRGEQWLRERLITEARLDAIIQLPKDALQPYSQLQTYLLLARQSERSSLDAAAPVWFYQIAHDGFSSGRNRRPQPEQSQLPQLMAAVAASQTEPAWKLRDESGASQLDIWPLATGGYRLAQPDKGRLRLDVMTIADAVALRLTRQTDEETRQGLLYQTAFWQKRPLPAMQNNAALVPLTFRLADGDDQQIALQQNGDEWQLKLKSIQPVKPVESWETEQRYWALFIANSGEPLSPLLQTSDLQKDFKPKSLTIVLLADEANELAGSLLLWDSKALQPLFFADGTDNDGWLLLLGHEEAAIIGWGADGLHSGAIGGRQDAFSGEPWHRGVVVDERGVHFGVGVDPATIRDERQFDLTFDRYYLSNEQETAAPQSAAEILGAMRQKQRGLTHKLDYLLGIVEMRPAQALPPSLVDAAPFGSLNQSQRLVWQRILEMSEGVNGTITARPFRPQELAAGLNEADVQQALTLLERMGVIVPVVIDGAPYYRRLTERDVVV